MATALAFGAAWPAWAEDLCADLTLPDELHLACRPVADAPAGTVAVAPTDGAFASLSRMTLRPLDRTGDDAQAWTDPPAWLRQQVTFDTTGLAESLAGLAHDPDSPFSGSAARTALGHLQSALAGMATLPLGGCEPPTSDASHQQWSMHCTYGAAGLGVFVDLRLIAHGERRWAIAMRTANEQRRRHFLAIAGSFQPS